MQLFLIRHAIAEESSPSGKDADRPLSGKGIERLQLELAGLQRLDLKLDALWSSPWTRARATAEILQPLAKQPLRTTSELARPPRAALWDALSKAGPQSIALVGHQPWLGELASLLASDSSSPLLGLRIKKGGMVWLEGDPAPGRMRLEAALPPNLLRALGGVPV